MGQIFRPNFSRQILCPNSLLFPAILYSLLRKSLHFQRKVRVQGEDFEAKMTKEEAENVRDDMQIDGPDQANAVSDGSYVNHLGIYYGKNSL